MLEHDGTVGVFTFLYRWTFCACSCCNAQVHGPMAYRSYSMCYVSYICIATLGSCEFSLQPRFDCSCFQPPLCLTLVWSRMGVPQHKLRRKVAHDGRHCHIMSHHIHLLTCKSSPGALCKACAATCFSRSLIEILFPKMWLLLNV